MEERHHQVEVLTVFGEPWEQSTVVNPLPCNICVYLAIRLIVLLKPHGKFQTATTNEA